MNCPLAKNNSEIFVSEPHEKPFVEMTMHWLKELGIKARANPELTKFCVQGEQQYNAFEKTIPADWSSAAFPLCAAAITKNSGILLCGLDLNDAQGDKEIINMLKKMGANITVEEQGIRVQGSELHGAELDLNSTPDALPVLAVVGCCAEGETRLVNVAQARIKETDRISAIAQELKKMGANIEEKPDGLVIRKSSLQGTIVQGHNDHRTVMALAVAGMIAEGITKIETIEAINKTFPNFFELMKKISAKIEVK